MVIMFALAAAVLYGSADFLGGAASRHSRALSVAVLSVPAGAVVMLAAAAVSGDRAPSAGLGWAVAAGGFGAVGLMVFYAGLAAGPMSVVAPVSALVSTVLPVGVAVASGEHLGGPVYAGAAVCLVATVLVSLERGTSGRPPAGSRPLPGHPALRGLAYGTVCGAMFGIFFVCMREAGTAGVFWPVCTSRLASSAVVIAVAVLAGARPVGRAAGTRVLVAAAAAGALDASANLCYVLATRAGLFGIAAVLTSLYPGITVLLARVVLRERMQAVQRIGLLLAGLGIVLVTL
jgi:drug/metabolite transporter (DMT)-like permease